MLSSALGGLVATLILLFTTTGCDDSPRTRPSSPDFPDQEIRSFTLTQTVEGRRDWRLTAASAATYRDRGVIVAELRPPALPTDEDPYPLLTVAAREGRLRTGAPNRSDLYPELGKVLPEGTAARFVRGSWPVLPVFEYMQRVGNVEQAEMDRTFNMGLGMVVVVAAADVEQVETLLRETGETSYRVGRIVEGAREVQYE